MATKVTNKDIGERMARLEERLSVTIEKLAEFIEVYLPKLGTTSEKIVGIEAILSNSSSKFQTLDDVVPKVTILWEARQSAWRILTPIISSLVSASIGGVLSCLIMKLMHP